MFVFRDNFAILLEFAWSGYGPVAHLVERVIRIDEASGSSPLGSTKIDLHQN